MEQALRVFYASAPQDKHRIEVLEFSHSALSRTRVLWREPAAGFVTTELGVVVPVEVARFFVEPAGTDENLDQVYDISLSMVDIEDDFRDEVDRVPVDTQERIRCVFRQYLSDALDDVLAWAVLQVEEIGWRLPSARIRAVSPRLNVTRTGELYVPREVPMLRSFL